MLAAMSDTENNTPAVPAPALPETQHVRIGGNAGLRVQHSPGGVTTHSRASAIPHHGAVRSVPIEALETVRKLLTDDSAVRPAGEVLASIHAVLEPWF